jgi:GTP-binding protein
MVVLESGVTTAYSLFALQERGRLFAGPSQKVYAGQVLGLCSRDVELVVNPTKGKKLTNIRSAGADDKLTLSPPKLMNLEACLEFIDSDELVEITPNTIRLRKRELDHSMRKRQQKRTAS